MTIYSQIKVALSTYLYIIFISLISWQISLRTKLLLFVNVNKRLKTGTLCYTEFSPFNLHYSPPSHWEKCQRSYLGNGLPLTLFAVYVALRTTFVLWMSQHTYMHRILRIWGGRREEGHGAGKSQNSLSCHKSQ